MASSFLPLRPHRALLHPAWLASVALLALNDHVLKGAHVLPSALTGKLSDVAGLFAAPALLATLLAVRSKRGLALSHLGTGLVFALIKLSPAASSLFTHALALVGLSWRNWVDPTDLLALPALYASWRLLSPAMAASQSETRRFVRVGVVVASLPVLLASGQEGGANQNQNAPGSGKTGVNLLVGDIAVDPGGTYFLSRDGSKLLKGDLSTRALTSIDGLPEADRVAFWPASRGRGFFVLTTGQLGADDAIVSYDVDRATPRWHAAVPGGSVSLVADPTGDRLVIATPAQITVLDVLSGATLGAFTPAFGVLDVAVTPDGARLLVVEPTQFAGDHIPSTHVYARLTADASAACDVVVPNCADQLVLSPDGARAFLAPTTCQRDPISVLAVADCSLTAQLPGFGPVALSPDAATAIGFLDRDANDPSAPPVPDAVKQSSQRFHLMFLDAKALSFTTLPVGDSLPRYTLTPDGQLLLVDSDGGDDNVRVLDLADRSLRTVTGPHVLLDDYVLTPDSNAAYALYGGLFRVDTHAATSTAILLTYDPTSINITPSGSTLLLKDDESVVHLWDVASSRETATVVAR